MKRALVVIAGILFSLNLYSQADSIQAPYKRFPRFPSVRLMMIDSTVITFNADNLPRKQPVMLMVFSPACEHCQMETDELVKKMDKFKKVSIIMVTMMPYADMMAFREKYSLERFPNILMGRDVDFYLPPFYDIKNLPFLAFYDKKGKFISCFSGSLPLDKVLEELEK